MAVAFAAGVVRGVGLLVALAAGLPVAAGAAEAAGLAVAAGGGVADPAGRRLLRVLALAIMSCASLFSTFDSLIEPVKYARCNRLLRL